jgi:recombination protein RecT
MAKKTCLKRVLKFAPLKSDFVKAVVQDESIKTSISEDMYEVNDEMNFVEAETIEVDGQEVNVETGEVNE